MHDIGNEDKKKKKTKTTNMSTSHNKKIHAMNHTKMFWGK